MRMQTLQNAVPGMDKVAERVIPHLRRESSVKWTGERIPTERTFKQAFLDIFTGNWMRLYLLYKPSPETAGHTDSRDVEAFTTTQNHIALLATLMLEVVFGFVSEGCDLSSPAAATFTVTGIIAGLFFFNSSLSSVIMLVLSTRATATTSKHRRKSHERRPNLTSALRARLSRAYALSVAQANTDAEAIFFLMCMRQTAVRPFQFWVSGVIMFFISLMAFITMQTLDPPVDSGDAAATELLNGTLSQAALIAYMGFDTVPQATKLVSFFILQIVMCTTLFYLTYTLVHTVKDVYLHKRAYKSLMLEMRTSGQESPSTSKFQIVVPLEEMTSALQLYVSMVGLEYINEGRFMEYLFQRFKPLLTSLSDEAFGDVLCELSMITRKRAHRLFNELVARQLESDVRTREAQKTLDAILWARHERSETESRRSEGA